MTDVPFHCDTVGGWWPELVSGIVLSCKDAFYSLAFCEDHAFRASPLVDGAFNRQLSFLLRESIAHLVEVTSAAPADGHRKQWLDFRTV